jgi:hypothetical protein
MSATHPLEFECAHTEQVLKALIRMARKGRPLASTVNRRLVVQLGVDSLAVAEALRELYRLDRVRYTPDTRGQPVSGYIEVVLPDVDIQAHHVAWRMALENAGFGQEVASVLLGLAAKLQDMEECDMALLAVALKNVSLLVKADGSGANEAGFNVSARRIMSGSKVLSMLSERMLTSLGLPLRLHLSSPRYLIYAGPPGASTTLLIENPRAFENAIRAGLAQSASLVCTYGFSMAYIGQDWLHGAQSSAHDAPIILPRVGTAPSFRELFAVEHVMFWGDLDVAGLAIYKAYASSLPTLKLSGIYRAMTRMLANAETSHPYCALFDKAGQAVLARSLAGSHETSAGHELFRLCTERAVDQEAVTDEDIMQFGLAPYTAEYVAAC